MLSRGDVLRDQNKLAEAVWSYVQAIELDPDSTEPAERIAYLHLREDPDKAESIFRSLIRSGASDASTVVGLGLAQLSQGQVHEAVKSLEESVAKEPDSARALESLGVAYNLIGRHDLARERLTQALQLRPGSSLIANNLGMSELMLRNLDAAEARFRLAMLLAPENVVAQNNLGLTLGLMGATEEAYDIFLLVGAEQSAHNNLGYVYLLSGDSEMALHHFEAALLAGGPDSLTILKNLSALDR
jgi:Flp pilus assembly protein TadD